MIYAPSFIIGKSSLEKAPINLVSQRAELNHIITSCSYPLVPALTTPFLALLPGFPANIIPNIEAQARI